MKYSLKKSAVSLLLSFLIAFLLVLAILCVGLKHTVCSEAFMLDAAEKSGYTDGVREYVRSEFLALASVSGIPEGVIDDFLSENFNEDDVLYTLRGAYSISCDQLNFTPFKQAFADALYSYALTLEGGADTDEFLSNIQEHADYYVDIYKNAVGAENLFGVLKAAVRAVDEYSGIVFIICITAALLLGLCLYLKNKAGALRYFYYSASSSLLVVSGAALLALYFDAARRIALYPYYIYDLVVCISESFFQGLFCIGIASLLILIAVSITITIKNQRKNKLLHSEEERTQ